MYNYFFINGIGKSFLKINDILDDYGFVVEAIPYKKFLSDFSGYLSQEAEVKDLMELSKFYDRSPIYDFIAKADCVVLIRSKFHISDTASISNFNEREAVTNKQISFISELVNKLRLYKSGYIFSQAFFDYDLKTKRTTRGGYKRPKVNVTHDGFRETYFIEDNEIGMIKSVLTKELIINDLSRIAFEGFNLTYEIEKDELKLLMFISSLESLFNLGRDQITHTIARHSALLIAESTEEFEELYKRIKSVYSFRSKLTHGGEAKSKMELNQNLDFIENIVRGVLKKTLKTNLDKNQLFSRLNLSGVKLVDQTLD